MNYFLGIDIGTTKVAVAICKKNGKLIESYSAPSNATLTTSPEESEQNPDKIFSTLDICFKKLSNKNLKKVVSIGITGQMHGVILWGKNNVSNLITWQDKRCYQNNFLIEVEEKTGTKLNSGFGSATLAWMIKHNKIHSEYTHAATIHDYLVACLCNLKAPVMDPTNAASWGLFDIFSKKWKKEKISQLNIPYNFYPKIVETGTLAGTLDHKYAKKWNLEKNVTITTAIGDNQASLLATLENYTTDISLTLGTGAQISTVISNTTEIECVNNSTSEIRPFINDQYILVAAPLCGGSAFAWLIEWFSQWCNELGVKSPTNEKLYDFFINAGLKTNKNKDKPSIESSFLGERHNSELKGKISNITLTNFTPGKVASALSEGIITNLKSMLPENVLKSKKRILASGNAIRHNALIRESIESIFNKPLIIIDSKEEAACGAAKLSENPKKLDYGYIKKYRSLK